MFVKCARRNRGSAHKHRLPPCMARVQHCERVTPLSAEETRVGEPWPRTGPSSTQTSSTGMYLMLHTGLVSRPEHTTPFAPVFLVYGQSSQHTAERTNNSDVRAWLSHQSSGDVLWPNDGAAGPVIKIPHHADESSFKKRRCPTQTETMARGDARTTADITIS